MSPRLLACYGFPALPLAFAALPLYVHLPAFYARHAGLSLALLGSLLLAARLLDALLDPFWGWWVDRQAHAVHSIAPVRLLRLSLPPFALGFSALFFPPVGQPLLTAFWLLAGLLLTYSSFSLASISYQAWGASLGQDSAQRTRLAATREGASLLGILLAAALPSLLALLLPEVFAGERSVQGLIFLLWPLTLLSVLGLYRLPDHPPQAIAPPVPEQAPRQALQQIWSDLPFRRLLLVFIANGIAAALPATLVLFFIADIVQAAAWSGAFLSLYFLAGVAGLPLWVSLATRYGRVPVWLGGMGLAMLAFASAYGLGADDYWAFALICLASGLALVADLALPAALAADHAERLQRGGLCFGLWNFISKLNLALAAGLSLPLLALLGYESGQSSPTGLHALSAVYALLPLGFKLLAALLLWHWRGSVDCTPPTAIRPSAYPAKEKLS